MATFTFTIPEDLKRQMDELPLMNWSEVVREAIRSTLDERQKMR